jgi:hypothetical protein
MKAIIPKIENEAILRVTLADFFVILARKDRPEPRVRAARDPRIEP